MLRRGTRKLTRESKVFDWVTSLLEAPAETFRLRGFASTVQAFDYDQGAARAGSHD